jgi:hypothetical protein
MYHRSLSLLFRTLLSALMAAYLLVQPGGSTAMAAKLSSQEISQFLANPTATLTANPNGGGRLVVTVRDLMLSDPATLDAIIKLLASANPAQQTAIGSGLGQAAQALVTTNPTLANQIQAALAASGVPLAIASYSAVTGNVEIGSTGGGGGGGGGSGGPVTGGTTIGGGGSSGAPGAPGGTGSASSGLTGGGSVGGSSTTGSGVASSVSPH